MTLEKLTIRKSTAPNGHVIVEGKAAPNATVVVENKSIATFAPGDTLDAFVRAQAAADGRFSLELPAAREGDHLRVRSGQGVLSVRVANVEAVDGRPPVIHQQGLRLVEDGPGSFKLTHVQKSDVVGEPGQILRFTNGGKHQELTLDEDGRLPKDARLKGKNGDVWQIATTDGAHNTSLRDISGALVAPPKKNAQGIVEPPPLAENGSLRLIELTGPLFGDPMGSARQGQVGDCWLVSAADAIASRAPNVLRERIKDNGDGTVTVTFKRYDHDQKRYLDEPITVSNSVYARGATPYYGQSTTGDRWFPLLEKAYAAWKGGYDGARSGYPFEAFEALLGAEGKHFDLDVSSADAVWHALSKPGSKNHAMVTWSRVESPALAFSNTGLVSDHAYAILGVEEKDGERIVRMRNPWGSNGWAAGSGPLKMTVRDNGVLEMKLEVFMKYFAGLGVAPT